MNTNTTNHNNDDDFYSLSGFFKILIIKKAKIFFLTLFIGSISFYFMYTLTLVKSIDEFFVQPIIINGDFKMDAKNDNYQLDPMSTQAMSTQAMSTQAIDINKYLSFTNINKAMIQSNIDTSNTKPVLHNLKLIKGENNIRNINKKLSSENLSRIIRDLMLDDQSLARIIKTVLNQKDKFYELTLNYSKVPINKIETKIFLSNLVKIINDEITTLYPQHAVFLSEITLVDNVKISDASLATLYYKFNAAADATNKLNSYYRNHNLPSINLVDLQIMINIFKVDLRKLLRSYPKVSGILVFDTKIKIANLTSRIETINSLIDNITNVSSKVELGNDNTILKSNKSETQDLEINAIKYLIDLDRENQMLEFNQDLYNEKKLLSYEILDLKQRGDSMFSDDGNMDINQILDHKLLYETTVKNLNKLILLINSHSKKDEKIRSNVDYLNTYAGAYIDNSESLQYSHKRHLIFSIFIGLILSCSFVILRTYLVNK